MDSLSKAIDIVGGPSALAKVLDVSPQVVSNWRARGRVSLFRCKQIERITFGRVKAAQLRPDIFGDPPKEAA